MAEITAKLVRELREKTGAGMMDCKKALGATSGDFEAAIDHLRKQGLKTAEKKSGRETGEGRVSATIEDDGKRGGMVAVSCETDFVAKTPDFEAFLNELGAHVLAEGPGSAEEILKQRWKGSDQTVEDRVKEVIGKLGENINVVDAKRFENPAGRVATYIHHNQKVGVLVSVTTQADASTAQGPLHDLCMHIAFSNPDGLHREEIPADLVEREKAIYLDEVKGKPEEIREKIVGGKLEKFFAGRVLVEQPWVKDDKLTVQKALEQALGKGTRVESFVRFQVGA